MSRVTEVAQGVFQITVMNVAVTLVLDGDRVVLLDAGLRTTPAHVLAFLDARGLRPQQVSHILVSHYHPDHIGGLRRLRELTGAQVAAHPVEAPVIAGYAPFPNPFAPPLLAAPLAGLARMVDPAVTGVDIALHDDLELDVAGGIRVLHTPGHTPGSVSYYLPSQGVLFVADALQRRFGRLGLPDPLFTTDMAAARRSVARLAAVNFDTLCFSHFAAVGTAGRAELRALAARVAA